MTVNTGISSALTCVCIPVYVCVCVFVCVFWGVSYGYLAHFLAEGAELRGYKWWQQTELLTAQPGDDPLPPEAPHQPSRLFIRRLADLSHGRLRPPLLLLSGRRPAGSLPSDWLERAGGAAASPQGAQPTAGRRGNLRGGRTGGQTGELFIGDPSKHNLKDPNSSGVPHGSVLRPLLLAP